MYKKIHIIILLVALCLIIISFAIIAISIKIHNKNINLKVMDTETHTVTTTSEPKADEPRNLHNDDWAFFLVNKNHPLPENYIESITLEKIYKDFMLDSRCAIYAREMINAAAKDEIKLIVVSAYRSPQKQNENFNNYIERLISEGHSAEDAHAITAAQIALPGESEHNAGLAVDFLSEDWYLTHDDITEDFENTEEFEWLTKNSWKYGFILRYPKGKTEITGFDYEPWHYRYLGISRAKEVYESGLSLDEFILSASN